MRVFVVGTGRCGTVTYSKACRHISNYTHGHESRMGEIADNRLDYPPRHIEVDNRLSWYIPRILRLGWDVLFINLIRDIEETVNSFIKRHKSPALIGWSIGVLYRGGNWTDGAPRSVARDYVETIRAWVEHALRDVNSITIDIAEPEYGFREMCRRIDAEVDMEVALSEFKVRYNAS